MRGAVNAALCLPEDELSKGLATHSSGNFAQAVALSRPQTRRAGMYRNAGKTRHRLKDAVRGYGAQVVECEPTQEARANPHWKK